MPACDSEVFRLLVCVRDTQRTRGCRNEPGAGGRGREGGGAGLGRAWEWGHQKECQGTCL